MASKVQLNLEKRLGELRDLERKGIFTPLELQEVVRRRTRHETACVRQGTQYKDFLEYIEYENKLESLRVMRSRRMSASVRLHSAPSLTSEQSKKNPRPSPTILSLEAYSTSTLERLDASPIRKNSGDTTSPTPSMALRRKPYPPL